MKQLLLTLLGVAALCGLSPHPAAAQEHSPVTKTYTVTKSNFTNGLVSMGKRVKGALEGATNTADYTLSDSESITPTDIPTGQDAHGYGQYLIKSAADDDDPLTIDFDFSNCSTTPKNENPAWYQNTSYINTSIYTYTGAKLKISLSDKKRIKSIQIQTNMYGNNLNKALQAYKKNIKCIKDFSSDVEDDRFTLSAVNLDNDGITVKYESSRIYGDEPNLTLDFVNPDGYYHLQIRKIIVQYYDNSDGWMPKYDNTMKYGKNYADVIYYKDDDATDWTEATGSERIKLNGATVKTRIGNAMTTFTRPASPKPNQPTVIIDPVRKIIGATIGVTFYTTLDPDYSASDDINEAYSVEYQLNNYAATGTSATYANSNVTAPTGAIGGTAPVISAITNVAGLDASNSTYTVKASISYDPFNTGTYAATTDQKNGLDMAFGFDGLKIRYTSKIAPPVQLPMVPEVTISSGAVQSNTGIYNLFKDLKVTAAHNAACIYPEAKIYYIFGDTQLDDKTFDKSKATLVGEDPIVVTGDGYLSIRSYATVDGNEICSGVATYQFKKIESIRFSNAGQLLDKANNGKLVYLDFPIQTLASGTYTADPNTYIVYARDTTGTPLKFVSRMNAKVTTASKAWPGAAFQATAGRVFTQIPFIPAGGAVGQLSFDDQGHPYILLKDEANDIDYFDYCYAGAYKRYTDIFKDNIAKGLKFVTDTYICNPIEKFSADDYGKIVYIKAKYTKTGNLFHYADDTQIDVRLTTATGFISQIPNNTYAIPSTTALTDGADVVITGLVEYDAEANEGNGGYYIIPRGINIAPTMPTVSIGNISNGTTLVEDSYKLNEEGNAAEATIKMVSGKMLLQFSGAAGTTKNYFYSYYNPTSNSDITGSKTTTSATLTSLVFDDDRQIKITINTQDCAYSQAPFAVSEPFTLTVTDIISTAPGYNSIAEVKKELNGKTAEQLKDKYYRVDGKMVVLGFDPTYQYMYLRDAEADGYIIAYTKNKWNNANFTFVHGNYYTWTSFSTWSLPRIGDQITTITFTPAEMSGVMVADLTGLEGSKYDSGINQRYNWAYIKGHSYSDYDEQNDPDKTIWGELGKGNPMYKNHMERLGAPIRKDLCYDASNEADAAKLTFDDSNIADYVAINNVKLTANEDTDPVFSTTGLGTNLEIDWSLLPAAESTAALAEDGDETEEPAVKDVKAEIIKAYNDAKTEGKDIYFNIQGHIFKNATATGYALKIKDYSITEAAPLPTVKVTAAGNEIVATPDADDASKLAASFIKTVSVSSPDAELEDADFEILMSINGGEYEAYDAAKLDGFDTHNTTVAFKCPLRPGYLAGDRITTLTLSKDASDVNTLAEMAGGDNANNLYHFRKHLKVVAAAEGTVMAADKEGNLAVVAAAPAEAEEGKYLADIVLVRNSKNTASLHEIDADAELLDEDESYAIATPAPATLFGVTVAEGNATDAKGNTYAIDPTFAAIPEGDAEAWKLTGYVLADDNDKPVIYLTASQAIHRVALPVITPAEAAFLDKTTVSITCDTEGAAIEYSLDGGKTWNPYTGAFDATASGEILARATADDMLPSHEAKASVVREYLSGDVTITVDEQEALTVITINGPAGAAIYYSLDGAAEKLYNGPLTLTNDTQAVINGQIKAYALESGKRPGAESVKDYQIKFKPEVTGIDGVGADQEAGSVRVEGNSIIVPEGAQTFDIAGRRVNPQGLPRGIYIVRLASGKAVKAVVK